MRKVLKSHSEVAHVWASQSQEEGKSNNFFFEGTTLYSYGRHFPVANFVNPNVVLFNDASYSSSTNKHQSHARRAIGDHIKIFYVPTVKPDVHDSNVENYIKRVNHFIDAAGKSIKYSANSINHATAERDEMVEYIKEFKLKKSLIPKALRGSLVTEKTQGKIDRQAEAAKQREEREIRENKVKSEAFIKDFLPRWLSGYNDERFYYDRYAYPKESYLRVTSDGNRVQTLHGATVHIDAAKVLYDKISKGENVIGHTIENFKVLGMNGVLKIGCHIIEKSEIERFASSQGWSK